jgi:cephalosporin-C deacetylase-like acetyl esterase
VYLYTKNDMDHDNTTFANEELQASAELIKEFDIYSVPYKIVNSHPIYASVLLPKKSIGDKPRPLLVRIHGGGVTEGNREGAIRPW